MWIPLLALVVVAAACGQDTLTVVSDPGTSVPSPYDGPLHVRVDEPDHPDPLVRSGAAGRALECDGEPYLGSTGSNAGFPSDGETREEGLVLFVNDEFAVPKSGYRVERQGEQRTLYSYDVDGQTKVAVIVAAGTDDVSGDGWGAETFAQCDPAEFAPETDDEIGLQVWTDRNGERVPTTKLASQAGSSHCGWENVTFLELEGHQYLRDPDGVFDSEDLVVPYDGDAQLPDDAIDSGYQLGEQHLWLAADKSSVYVVTPGGTERWPATVSVIACA